MSAKTSHANETAINNASNIDAALTPPRSTFLSYLLFPVFLIGFLGVLIVVDPIQRIGIIVGRRAHELSIVLLNMLLELSMRFTGCSVERSHLPELSPDIPYIVVTNHQSLFDIPFIHNTLRSHYPRFIAKRELGRWIPSVSFNLRNGQNALIDRSDPRQAIREISRVGALAEKQKFSVAIFPEGTRARDGRLKKFRSPGFQALIKSIPSAKVIALTIDRSWRLAYFRRGPIPLGVRVQIVGGKIYDPAEYSSAKELLERIRTDIDQTLLELRS